MLIDTNRENEIQLGISYPFKAQKKGSCLISSYYEDHLSVEIGDLIKLEVSMNEMLRAMASEFNQFAVTHGYKKVRKTNNYSKTKFTCKVSGFLKESYGKYPKT